MFGVHLREAEYFRVSQRPSEFFGEPRQIGFFLGAQRETFSKVVSVNIFNVDNRGRGGVNFKDIAVKALIYTLKHLVVSRRIGVVKHKLLDTSNAAETHVLSNLYGVGTPRSYHFTTRAYKAALKYRLG